MNKAIIGVIVAAIVVPVAVYALSPYFTESTIDEALPENVVTTQAPTDQSKTAEVAKAAEKVSTEEGEEIVESSEVIDAVEITDSEESAKPVEIADAAEITRGEESEEMTDAEMTDTEESAKPVEIADAAEITKGEETAKEVLKTYEGQFVGVGDGIHDAQGTAKVLPLDDGSQILRLEEFRSTNGPDLYVYLATDKNASEFVSLGELKANQGNQNYEIPNDVDLEEYDQVLIWCKAFSVLFGNAELMSQ